MSSGPNDVAILKLDRPLEFNSYVRPIDKIHCGSSPPPSGTPIINIGFGISRPGVSGILRYGYNYLENDCKNAEGFMCSDLYGRDGKETNVVASGDSGGPVVIYGQDRKFEQIGINSGAFPHRGFYAPTYLNCDWIRSVTTIPE
jgi:hypothetical protein